MKKFTTLALAAAMALTLSLGAAADGLSKLGNYVLSSDTLESAVDNNDSNPTLPATKINPETGAGNLDLAALSVAAAATIAVGAASMRR